ncbi:MAG: response regulator transcription factor [Bacteroidetes bacterium]|nr:response regulator transcription factor [Bacteroidota bacterium]MBS1756850.1 response regulator transcription factor [Bacteroidota bacterium]
MNIRCLIIDDEPLAVRLISSYVQQVPVLEIVAVCNNAIEAFRILGEQKIDLMFLDIKMPKLIGTDFLRSISNPPKVIFITAFRDYALDGYELDIVDYLMKPVSFARFMKAVSKVTKLISIDNNFSTLNTEHKDNENSFLYFKINKEMQKVLLHEILFIESNKEYVKLFLENGKKILVKQSISSLQKLLSPHRFLRIHRSYIITIEKIYSYNSTYITIGNHKIPIGRLYKNEVERVLKH